MKKMNQRLLVAIFPLVSGFGLFYVLPLIGSVWYAFIKSAFDHLFVGLDNFRETLANPYFRLSMKNTLEMILLGVPLLIAIALLVALFLDSVQGRIPVLMQAALIMPMLLPSAAVTNVFGKILVENARLPLLAVFVWKNTGFMMLIFLAALSAIPQEMYEAAALDGAGGIRRFFSMTMPMISGALMFSGILGIVYNLRLFREAYLLYGAYPEDNVYLLQHYMNNHFYKLNYQSLTSAAILFALGMMVLLGSGLKLVLRLTEEKSHD